MCVWHTLIIFTLFTLPIPAGSHPQIVPQPYSCVIHFFFLGLGSVYKKEYVIIVAEAQFHVIAESPLHIHRKWVPGTSGDIKTHRCSCPLYKIFTCDLHTSCMYFEWSLDDSQYLIQGTYFVNSCREWGQEKLCKFGKDANFFSDCFYSTYGWTWRCGWTCVLISWHGYRKAEIFCTMNGLGTVSNHCVPLFY
jgi:hypothetical protein